MAIHVDSAYPGQPVDVSNNVVSSGAAAGTVALTINNVRKGLTPTINLPDYFNVVKVSDNTYQIQHKGVAIPKTATTLIATVGTQVYKTPLFVT